MTSPPIGILLAAGRSTRFGSNKLLLPLADGTPMAVVCARTLHSVLPHCIAVVDDERGEVARLLAQAGLEIAVNPRAHDGMGTSIACGVSAAAAAAGWIVALADMPRVPVSVIGQIANSLACGADAVAPVYRGRRGHPVGFSARHAAALRALAGDRGARDILSAASANLSLIETGDSGVILDVDTPDDLLRPNVQ